MGAWGCLHHGMALGAARPPKLGRGFSGAGEGGWLVQGELPLHPALLQVRYLLHSPRNAFQGLSFSICAMGTCIPELLYLLGSGGAAPLTAFGF